MIKKNTIITFYIEETHIQINILLSYNNKID